MANTSAPFGFAQDSGNGSSPTYEQVVRQAQYNASAIYYGDPVTSQTDGTIAISSAGTTPDRWHLLRLQISVSRPEAHGLEQLLAGSDVASGNYVECYIVNDPNARFIVQSGATGLTLADIGANVQFNIGTPSSVGISGATSRARTRLRLCRSAFTGSSTPGAWVSRTRRPVPTRSPSWASTTSTPSR